MSLFAVGSLSCWCGLSVELRAKEDDAECAKTSQRDRQNEKPANERNKPSRGDDYRADRSGERAFDPCAGNVSANHTQQSDTQRICPNNIASKTENDRKDDT